MKRAIGFLFCTAFYGVFFYWVKMNYGDEIVPQLVNEEIEIVQRYVLLFAPGIFMVFFCSGFSYLCLYKTRFGLALLVSLVISFLFGVLIIEEGTNTGSVLYYIYLVVLWILSICLSFVGSKVRSEVRSDVRSEVRSEVRSDVRSEVRSVPEPSSVNTWNNPINETLTETYRERQEWLNNNI